MRRWRSLRRSAHRYLVGESSSLAYALNHTSRIGRDRLVLSDDRVCQPLEGVQMGEPSLKPCFAGGEVQAKTPQPVPLP